MSLSLTGLMNLSIEFISLTSRSAPTNSGPPLLTCAVLPALTDFAFYGVSEYLEDLIARMDAPLLDIVEIKFFNQLVFDIQQLSRFIGYALSCDTANIVIYMDYSVMAFSSIK